MKLGNELWFWRGGGTLKQRNVRLLAGECPLVKCPDAARRSCRRKRSLYGLFTSRHSLARSRTFLYFSCCIRAEDKASFLGRLHNGGSGFVLAFLSYIYVRSLCVGIHTNSLLLPIKYRETNSIRCPRLNGIGSVFFVLVG